MAKRTTKKSAVTDLCKKCKGLCCRYMALPIETPENRQDYDDIRWYLCHKDITVFVEDGDWYINVKNKCRHLNEKDYRCKIYETRPHICRKYHTDACELVGNEYDYELHFTNDRQMEEYIRVKFDNNRTDHPSHQQSGSKVVKSRGKNNKKKTKGKTKQ